MYMYSEHVVVYFMSIFSDAVPWISYCASMKLCGNKKDT